VLIVGVGVDSRDMRTRTSILDESVDNGEHW
jgi:hypothetical protein